MAKKPVTNTHPTYEEISGHFAIVNVMVKLAAETIMSIDLFTKHKLCLILFFSLMVLVFC